MYSHAITVRLQKFYKINVETAVNSLEITVSDMIVFLWHVSYIFIVFCCDHSLLLIVVIVHYMFLLCLYTRHVDVFYSTFEKGCFVNKLIHFT